MTFTAYRTSNRHSLRFKARRAVRRMRERVLAELISLLEGNGSRSATA